MKDTMYKVLIVDDDAAIAEMLTLILTNAGYTTSVIHNGNLVMEKFSQIKPQLVLLDIMLPGKNGIALCRQIREFSHVPIIMLTAKSGTAEVVAGLEAGADDYIVKPFKPRELIARIKARLRTTVEEYGGALSICDLDIDPDAHRVSRGDEVFSLTPLEFDLLLAFARKPGQVFSREVLLQQVWGYTSTADPKLVNVHVQRLRSKVEKDPDNPEIVLTIRGVGYKAGPP